MRYILNLPLSSDLDLRSISRCRSSCKKNCWKKKKTARKREFNQTPKATKLKKSILISNLGMKWNRTRKITETPKIINKHLRMIVIATLPVKGKARDRKRWPKRSGKSWKSNKQRIRITKWIKLKSTVVVRNNSIWMTKVTRKVTGKR